MSVYEKILNVKKGVSMELITPKMLDELPTIEEFDKPFEDENMKLDDVELKYKFFCPWSDWKWYPTAYDKDTKIFFGAVDGLYVEWGSFSLEELEEQVGPVGMRIERDLYFTPVKFKDLKTTGERF